MSKEQVNHPDHYNSHPSGIECIEVVQHFGFNIGNVVKYCWREGLKHNDGGIEDLKKARFYLDQEIKLREKETNVIISPTPDVRTSKITEGLPKVELKTSMPKVNPPSKGTLQELSEKLHENARILHRSLGKGSEQEEINNSLLSYCDQYIGRDEDPVTKLVLAMNHVLDTWENREEKE